MAGIRRRFSKAFKVGAIKLITEQGYAIGEAARRLEIDRKCLHDWLGKYAPGFDAASAAKDLPQDTAQLQTELRRLRRENDRLRAERDILKKAAAYFAKDQP